MAIELLKKVMGSLKYRALLTLASKKTISIAEFLISGCYKKRIQIVVIMIILFQLLIHFYTLASTSVAISLQSD